ncbi:proline-rich protein 36 isoform X2 [Esox lucius]|uniref:proline-rich protein 36 isoform X2 n=1 Tax=Esox lucius TaxID=8010 RepID=UPI001476D9E7|nr:proline-rich protein 36 isoform X2 [Esox lucius]
MIPYHPDFLDVLMPPMVPKQWASTPPLQGRPLANLGKAVSWVVLPETTKKTPARPLSCQRTREAQEMYQTGAPEPLLTPVDAQQKPRSPPSVFQEPLVQRFLTMLTDIKYKIPYLLDFLDFLMPPMVPKQWASTPPLQGRPLTNLGKAVSWVVLPETTAKTPARPLNCQMTREAQEMYQTGDPGPLLTLVDAKQKPHSPPSVFQEPLIQRFLTMLTDIKYQIPYLPDFLDFLMPPMVPKQWASTPPLQGRPLANLGKAVCWVEFPKTTAKTPARPLNCQKTREAQEMYQTGDPGPLLTLVDAKQKPHSPPSVFQEPLIQRFLTMLTDIKYQIPYLPDFLDFLMPPMVPKQWASTPPLQGRPLANLGKAVCWVEFPKTTAKTPARPLNCQRTREAQETYETPVVVHQEPLPPPTEVKDSLPTPSVVHQEPLPPPTEVKDSLPTPSVVNQEPLPPPTVVKDSLPILSVVHQESLPPPTVVMDSLPILSVVHQEPLPPPTVVQDSLSTLQQEPVPTPSVVHPQTRPHWMCRMNNTRQVRTRVALIYPQAGTLSQAPPRNWYNIWFQDLGIQEDIISMLKRFSKRLIALTTGIKLHHGRNREPLVGNESMIQDWFPTDILTKKDSELGSLFADTLEAVNLPQPTQEHLAQEPLIQVIQESLIQEPQIQVIQEPLIQLIQEPLIQLIQEPLIQLIQEPLIQLIHEPLIQLIHEPLIQEPLTQVTQEPLTQVTHIPLAQEPMDWEPLAQEPQKIEPLTPDPLALEPAEKEPLPQNPLDMETLTQEPLTMEPLTQEALDMGRLPQEPWAWMEGSGWKVSWSFLVGTYLLWTFCRRRKIILRRPVKASMKALQRRKAKRKCCKAC